MIEAHRQVTIRAVAGYEGPMEHQAFEATKPLYEGARVAVLVDGDNIAADWAGHILVRAGRLGRVIVKRVYCDLHHVKNWESSAGFDLQIARTGSNAADMLLTIEAVDLAHRGDIAAIAIASSDNGFAPLGRYLVERGLVVLGLGEAKASPDWRKSCTRFEVLERPRQDEQAPASPGVPAKQARPPGSLDEQVREELALAGPDGLPLTAFGHRMQARNFTKANLQEGSWRNYLEARSDIYLLDPIGPNARVRLKAASSSRGLVASPGDRGRLSSAPADEVRDAWNGPAASASRSSRQG